MRFVSSRAAIEIARQEIALRDLPFDEPIRVSHGIRSVHVWTRADQTGGNVVITIDRFSGRVSRVWTSPR